jgi:phosphohistidine phosphatase
MKILLLVRHAKSSWDDPAMTDFDRPLNERGKKDAPAMADKLIARGITVDSFISSPAKRAKKTAKIFSQAFKRKEEEIILVPELYLASSGVFESVLASIESDSETIALFSHNPGITDFANTLTEARIDDIPTCGIFAVSIDTDDWKNFRAAKKEFLFFDYPKA